MNWWPIGRAVTVVFVTGIMQVSGVHAQWGQEHFLDLVDVTVPSDGDVAPPEQLRVERTGRVTPTHSPRPVTPATISLSSLDRSRYVVGEKLIYEVVITNTSGRALAFPTMVDPRFVRRGMPGATLATISLGFEDEVFGMQLVALQLLYGADPVPNSTELLRPGDTLRLRASGAWWLGRAFKSAVPSRVVRDLQVKAHLGIYYLPDDHPVQISANFVPIQLQLNY